MLHDTLTYLSCTRPQNLSVTFGEFLSLSFQIITFCGGDGYHGDGNRVVVLLIAFDCLMLILLRNELLYRNVISITIVKITFNHASHC